MARKKISVPPAFRPEFYGTTVLGERGQAVVPAEARKALGLKKGEKLLVFGMRRGIVLTKLSGLEKFEERLSKRLADIREVIRKNK